MKRLAFFNHPEFIFSDENGTFYLGNFIFCINQHFGPRISSFANFEIEVFIRSYLWMSLTDSSVLKHGQTMGLYMYDGIVCVYMLDIKWKSDLHKFTSTHSMYTIEQISFFSLNLKTVSWSTHHKFLSVRIRLWDDLATRFTLLEKLSCRSMFLMDRRWTFFSLTWLESYSFT